MVGIISVVIGGHFGGGDHFDGEDHRAKIEKKALAPRALRFLVTYKLSRVALRTRMLRIYFDFFFLLSSRYPFAFLFIASMKSWLASISNKGTNLICKISSVFLPNAACCLSVKLLGLVKICR